MGAVAQSPLALLVPAAWCVGLAVGGAWTGRPAVVLAVLGVGGAAAFALAAAALGWRSRRGLLLLAAFAVGVAGLARGAAAVRASGPGSADFYLGRQVSLDGTVARSSGSATFQSFWLSDLRLRAGPTLEGTVQVTSRSPVVMVPGSRVRAVGNLERLPARALDGTTGFDDRMERRGVLAAMPSATTTVLAPSPAVAPAALAWRARNAIAAAVRAHLPEPEATILLGELVGIRGRLTPGVEADLVDSGLVHLLAVSGLKVALLGGLLAAALRHAGRRAALLAIMAVFAYAAVGGGSAAALRAACMTSMTLLAGVLRRDPDPARGLLLVAAAMLGLDPALAGDLSFQYSFLGVAGIQLGQPWLARRLRLLPRGLRDGLAVGLAAQLATLPVTAAQFHVVPVGGPLANTLAVPLLAPTMVVTGWVAAGYPDPGGVLSGAVLGAARFVLLVAGLSSHLPGGVLRVPWFGAAHVAAYYAAVVVLLATLRGVSRHPGARWPRPLHAAATAGVCAAVATLVATSLPDGRVRMSFLDTPGGGALLTAPDGTRLLIDTGTSGTALGAALDAHLGPGARPLEAVVLTGSHHAAAGGVEGLGSRVPAAVMVPVDAAGGSAASIAAVFGGQGAAIVGLAPGDSLAWHGLTLAVSSCGPGLGLLVGFGAARAWVCDGGSAADPPPVPPHGLAVADLGNGVAEPGGPFGGSPWVVIHGSRAGRGSLSAASLGPRLWRTARDGALEIVCDRAGCHR